ncbi:AMP-dependent synthetase ligase [Fusarium denticulatum]|uniref:AMP-dependent synthetase ligase n=1 Tax=Fusarium denticulatum TaxID=48507 RepID=A0A8H5U5L0_9HYPO|nr:AMP-dependent synthetase ligase [Fusarium denticulatum]
MPAWTETLLSRANDYHVGSVLPFTAPADFAFWDIRVQQNAALVGRADTAFRTDPDDLMLAARAFSFPLVFPKRSVPPIYAEGHGPSARDDSIDVSHTDVVSSILRMALMDTLAPVEGSELVLSLGYNARISHHNHLQQWLQEYSVVLQSLATELPQFLHPSLQETDFPLLGTDDAGLRFSELILDSLLEVNGAGLKSLAAACETKVGSGDQAVIKSIYPCSPLQQHILVSQFKDPKAYMVYAAWNIRPTPGMPLNARQLKNARR